MRKWSNYEKSLILAAIKEINKGKSIYSQVKFLYNGLLKYRTWRSIESEINKLRKIQRKSHD